MLNDIKPTAEEAAELQSNFDLQCSKAADALAQADILIFVTGAGWGADSGLAVYGDIANVPAYQQRGLEYSDVCQPHWVETDPGTFYGFWGQCFNDYRSTKPHEGYDIIARWRQDKNKAKEVADAIRTKIMEKVDSDRPFDGEEIQRLTPYQVKCGPAAGAFYCFTSNVDGHFYDKLEANEIHDCHGCIELWQCSNRDCSSGIWRAPIDYKFVVDKSTMLAPEKKTEALPTEKDTGSENQDGKLAGSQHAPSIGNTAGKEKRNQNERLRNMPEATDQQGWLLEDKETSNWPKCGHCGSLARPAIFMFGDFGWKYDQSQNIRWELWREAVIESAASRNEDYNVCVVEVGCGARVETCRSTSEEIVLSVHKNGGDATLVRINPDFPLTRDETVASDLLIPIMSGGLRAIKRVDEIYTEKLEIAGR